MTLSNETHEFEKALAITQKALTASKAHDWLMEFAPVKSTVDDGGATVTVRQSHGSSCPGSAEGHAYLQRAAKALLEKIGDDAMQMAAEDMQAARAAMAKLGEAE